MSLILERKRQTDFAMFSTAGLDMMEILQYGQIAVTLGVLAIIVRAFIF